MRALILLASATIATSAYAQLDAPIVEHPTTRTEIKRGYDAGALCDRYTMEADAVDPCVARILAQNRITHPSSDAFEAGLNVRKWVIGAKYIEAGRRLPDNRLAQDWALDGKISAGDAEMAVTELANKLKITLTDAFNAAGVVPANRPESILSK